MSQEMIRKVARLSKESETVTRETLKFDQHAWAHAIPMYLMLAGCRAFWPMSCVGYQNPLGIDVSGNGHHLTSNNWARFGYDANGLVPCVNFIRASSKSLSKTDAGAGDWADIIGTDTYIETTDRGLSITMIIAPSGTGTAEYLQAKYPGANGAYYVLRLADDTIEFGIVNSGASTTVTSTETAPAGVWSHIHCTYFPSTSLNVYVNGVIATNVAAIPASIDDTADAFYLGGRSDGASYYDGSMSMVGLYAAAHLNAAVQAAYSQIRSLTR